LALIGAEYSDRRPTKFHSGFYFVTLRNTAGEFATDLASRCFPA
jgi:hypothetical protein